MATETSNALFDDAVEPPEIGSEHSENTGEEEPASPPDELQAPGITLESLQGQVSNLARANRGLTNDLIDHRSKRQQLQGRLDQITDVFSKSQQARQQPEQPPEAQQIPDEIPIDFKDDGTPFVKTEDIIRLTAGGMQHVQSETQPKIVDLESKLAQLTAITAQKEAINQQTRGLNALIGSKPSYPDGFKQLTGQWQALNQIFDKFIYDNSLPIPKSVDEAIGTILSSPVKTEFQKQFPNTDVELLTEAFTTPNQATLERKLRRMLDGVTPQTEQGLDPKLRALASKPSNFGRVRNQMPGADTTLRRVQDMDIDDFLKLSDDDVDKVHDILAQEET